jgi:hypothetical protein
MGLGFLKTDRGGRIIKIRTKNFGYCGLKIHQKVIPTLVFRQKFVRNAKNID